MRSSECSDVAAYIAIDSLTISFATGNSRKNVLQECQPWCGLLDGVAGRLKTAPFLNANCCRRSWFEQGEA